MAKVFEVALYHKVVIGYAMCFVINAVAMSIVAGMSGLRHWSDLTSLQWFVLACAIMGSCTNVLIAFFSTAAQRLKRGGDLIGSTGDTTQFVLQPPPGSAKGARTTETKTPIT